MGENFRNDVDIALSAAQSALDAVEGADMRDLPISDKLRFALAQATVAVAYGVRKIAEIHEADHDARRQERARQQYNS